MARKSKPRLRYFARFRGDFGYLRAVVRHGKIRKNILTPIVIAKEQMPRLDTSGSIIVTNHSDMVLKSRIKEFTRILWYAVTPLIDSGAFDAMPGKDITNAILDAKAEFEQSAYRRNLARLGYDVSQMAPGYDEPGFRYATGEVMSDEDKDLFIVALKGGSTYGKQ